MAHDGSKRQQMNLLLLFPSAVLTASGSKGISQRKGTPKVFCKARLFYSQTQIAEIKRRMSEDLPEADTSL